MRRVLPDGFIIDSELGYFAVCNECGKEFKCRQHIRSDRRICPNCKDREKEIREILTNDMAGPRVKLRKFDEAVSRIESNVKNVKSYQPAIDTIRKVVLRKGWFQSTEEIMAGIELIKNGVRTIHQQKVGKYRVDFALPDMKVILEIDGKPFHSDKTKEGIRDGNIQLALGLSWYVVRIDTDLINKNISKLVPAIKAAVEAQEKDRARLRSKGNIMKKDLRKTIKL